jgi:Cu+-exporting ATPase
MDSHTVKVVGVLMCVFRDSGELLAQSNVGISRKCQCFFNTCNYLEATQFSKLYFICSFLKKAIVTIKMSFTLSLIYNVIGLTFAITAKLNPLVAAIIMPLSTVTIVSFVTVMSNYYAKNLSDKRFYAVK